MADKPAKMNPVVHFEMPAEDRKRMADFYTDVFGWKTQRLGPEMGDYVIATTTETDDTGRPKNPGAINGGFFLKSDDKPAQYPSVVIAVEDIKEVYGESGKSRRRGAWRAVGYPRCRIVCVVYRHGRQPGKHAPAAHAHEMIGSSVIQIAKPITSSPATSARPTSENISAGPYEE